MLVAITVFKRYIDPKIVILIVHIYCPQKAEYKADSHMTGMPSSTALILPRIITPPE
jgi:hypothetical protein